MTAMASQLDTQRGAVAAEAGAVNDVKLFWQVRYGRLGL